MSVHFEWHRETRDDWPWLSAVDDDDDADQGVEIIFYVDKGVCSVIPRNIDLQLFCQDHLSEIVEHFNEHG